MKQTQSITGGAGFCAQNDHKVHFGLGNHPTIEKLDIQWGSGTIQTLKNFDLNKINEIKEQM